MGSSLPHHLSMRGRPQLAGATKTAVEGEGGLSTKKGPVLNVKGSAEKGGKLVLWSRGRGLGDTGDRQTAKGGPALCALRAGEGQNGRGRPPLILGPEDAHARLKK